MRLFQSPLLLLLPLTCTSFLLPSPPPQKPTYRAFQQQPDTLESVKYDKTTSNNAAASASATKTTTTANDLMMNDIAMNAVKYRMKDGPGFAPMVDEDSKRSMLQEAYLECKRITSIYAKTFYLGTSFLELPKRSATWAIYVWCRRTDDIVDSPRAILENTMDTDLEQVGTVAY